MFSCIKDEPVGDKIFDDGQEWCDVTGEEEEKNEHVDNEEEDKSHDATNNGRQVNGLFVRFFSQWTFIIMVNILCISWKLHVTTHEACCWFFSVERQIIFKLEWLWHTINNISIVNKLSCNKN